LALPDRAVITTEGASCFEKNDWEAGGEYAGTFCTSITTRLWNGPQVDFGQQAPPKATIKVPHASSLNDLLTPSLFHLGKASVEDKIQVEGRVNETCTAERPCD